MSQQQIQMLLKSDWCMENPFFFFFPTTEPRPFRTTEKRTEKHTNTETAKTILIRNVCVHVGCHSNKLMGKEVFRAFLSCRPVPENAILEGYLLKTWVSSQ